MDFSKTSIKELAAIVASHLAQHDIEAVLVGGLAVEIYTDNRYLTRDIDMVNINYTKAEKLHAVMKELGFYKKGRIYISDTTDITIEFPSAPLSIGDEIIHRWDVIEIGSRKIAILHAEDVVKDRLAAFIHWRDRQSLVQAVMVMLTHGLNAQSVEAFCLKEGNEEHYHLLTQLFSRSIEKQLDCMQQIEAELVKLLLKA